MSIAGGQYAPLHWGEVAQSITVTAGGVLASGSAAPRKGVGDAAPRVGTGGRSAVVGRGGSGKTSGKGGTSAISGRGGKC